MTVTRYNWLNRLRTTVRAWEDRSFSWGQNDCVHFAAACVEAVTLRTDTLADWPSYSNEYQALRLLAKNGTGLRRAVDATLGIESYDIDDRRRPRTGDLVMAARPVAGTDGRIGPGLGLVYLDPGSPLFVGKKGLETMSIDNCSCAWSLI